MKPERFSRIALCVLCACVLVDAGCWGRKFYRAQDAALATEVMVDSLLDENADLRSRIADIEAALEEERAYSRRTNAQQKLDLEEIKDQLNALLQMQRESATGAPYQGERRPSERGDASGTAAVQADTMSTPADSIDAALPAGTDSAGIAADLSVPSPVEIHRQVYLDFSRGAYELALEESDVFLREYADHPLGEEIHFIRGECYATLERHFDALKEFSLILQQYPGSQHVPGSLFRMAVLYEAIGEGEIAAGIVRRLVREHPYSEEAAAAEERFAHLLEEQ
jgi:TolA-binding protein